VDALLAAAAAEADLVRLRGHRDAGRHLAGVRRRVQQVVHRITERMRLELEEAGARAAELEVAAAALGDAARADAEAHLARTEARVRELLDAAETDAARVAERADRRSAETEAGATMMRSAVAEEVVRLRSEAAEELRSAREEAAATLRTAQGEAEELRSRARTLLDEARAEVTELRERRDRITGELSQLSGVIEALAVPDDDQATNADHPDQEHS